MTSTKRPFGQRYAFVVVAVIFLCLLISASVRAAPGVLLNPLQQAFGWDRDSISLAAAIGILLYGLAGPFAAALMERLGLRRTVIGALAVIAAATAASLFMTAPWHLMITWGLFSGVGTGAVAVTTVMSMAVAPFLPAGMPLVVGTNRLRDLAAEGRTGAVTLIEPPVDVVADRPGTGGAEFRARYGIREDEVAVVVVSRLARELKLEGIVTAMTLAERMAKQAEDVAAEKAAS